MFGREDTRKKEGIHGGYNRRGVENIRKGEMGALMQGLTTSRQQ